LAPCNFSRTYGLLHNAHKLLANEIGSSAIESENVFIQVVLKVLGVQGGRKFQIDTLLVGCYTSFKLALGPASQGIDRSN
jgi:hypothetical protein